jgi:hypothetical protein
MQKIFRRIDPDLLSIFALLAFGLVAYSNSFNAVFQYDDFHHILKNEALLDLTDLSRIFHYGKGRFLPYLTLAFNHRISKFDPISYHTFNFFVHYSAALFLYFLVLELCKTPTIEGAQLTSASFANRIGHLHYPESREHGRNVLSGHTLLLCEGAQGLGTAGCPRVFNSHWGCCRMCCLF